MVGTSGDTVSANFSSAADVPVTAASYTATGNEVNLSLGFAPTTGTELTVVKNTGLPFISGQFMNLVHGQEIGLNYNGIIYRFVANYFGGSGNDLVLHWLRQKVYSWGSNSSGQIGNNSTTDSKIPVLVDASGVLSGKTVVSVAAGSSHSLALCSDGTVVAWGNNYYGQLGNNSTTNSQVPVLVDASGVLSGKSVVSVAAGGSHSLALCSDGTVVAWGYNNYGQLGNNSTTNSQVPVLVDATGVLSGKAVVSIDARYSYSLALCFDGIVVGWGYNRSGQLGNNSTTDTNKTPVLADLSGVLSGKTVVSVAAGNLHSLALCSDGTVAAWGNNYAGQLGNNGTTNSKVPVLVDTTGVLNGKTVVAVACGADSSRALCSDGTVVAWGYNYYGQLGNNSTTNSQVSVLVDASGVLSGKSVVSVAAGGSHSLALCSDGTVASWGYNSSGRLGNNSTTNSKIPVLVDNSGFPVGRKSKMIAGGNGHSLLISAIPPGSSLKSLTLDAGDLSPAFSPGNISYCAIISKDRTAISVIPTAQDASLVRVNGMNVVSGSQSDGIPVHDGVNTITTDVIGEGGDVTRYTVTVLLGTILDAEFSSVDDVVITGDGVDFSVLEVNISLHFAPPLGSNLTLVRKSGLEWVTGRFINLTQGQVVNLPFNGRSYQFVANYFGGTGNDLVLEWANRRIASWGDNRYGQLGDGGALASTVPVATDPAGVLAGRTVVSLTASAIANLALCADGTLAAWGGNSSGQLGIGTNVNSNVPVIMNGMGALAGKRVIALGVGGNVTSLAVCSDGTIAAWGAGTSGELGDGTNTGKNIPVPVSHTGALSGKTVVAAAIGGYHCLALCSDGTVVAWGSNTYGQLGTASVIGWSNVPVLVDTAGVLSGKTVVAVRAGLYHSLALCSDGNVVTWGYNDYGQIGNGYTGGWGPEAVNVSGILAGRTVVGISAGSSTNIVLCSDGTMASWGAGLSGQLGNGANLNSNIPVAVHSTGVLADTLALNICEGGGGAFVVCTDGSPVAWGANFYGQVGDGSSINRAMPVMVDGTGELYGKRVLAIASGGSHSHAVLAEPDSGYIAWMSAHPGLTNKTELDDPDHDGVVNLTEYVLNGNPGASNTAILPRLAVGKNDCVFSFNRLASSAEDTTQVFQYSADMVHWSNVNIIATSGSEVVLGSPGPNGEQSVTVTIPKGLVTAMFGRLKLSRP